MPTLMTQQSHMQTSIESLFDYTQKRGSKKSKRQVIISLKIRFIKTRKLKLNITFSIVKE